MRFGQFSSGVVGLELPSYNEGERPEAAEPAFKRKK
jgi:hypothetical protein